MDTALLKPAHDGLIVRDPKTRTPLSKEGEIKPLIGVDGKFWRRRLNEGSVIIAESAVKKSKLSEEVDKKILKHEKKLGGKK